MWNATISSSTISGVDLNALQSRLRPLVLLSLLCFALAGCSKSSGPEELEFSGSTMGTTYSVKVVDLPKNLKPQQVADRIQAVLDDVNDRMSTYKPTSEVSRFNESPVGTSMKMSDETFTVLQKAMTIWRLSKGTFDITVGPLVNLWGFGPMGRPNRIPSPEEEAKAWARIGADALVLHPDTHEVEKHKDLYIDLSGIAKGFGVDKVAEALEALGIHRYLVEVGGEIRAGDDKSPGQPWRVAVEKPVSQLREVEQVINVNNLAMATSGNYRNYFEENGHRYSHEIDPRTGKPIAHNLASASVVATDCADADAWATAMMVLGPKEGMEVANANNLPVYMLVKEGDGFKPLQSKAFDMYLKPKKQ